MPQVPGSGEVYKWLKISDHDLRKSNYHFTDFFQCFRESLLQVMTGGRRLMGFVGTMNKQLCCTFLNNKSDWPCL